MKTIIYSILLLLLCSNQLINAQRLLQDQKAIEVGAGLVSNQKPIHDFFYISAGMTINKKNGNYQLWALEYAKKKHEFENIPIPVESFTAEGGYSFCLFGDWAKNISLNLGLTAIGGYEVINHGDSILPNGAVIQNKDGFIYGGGLRLSLETYLGNRLVLLIQGRTKYLGGTSVERFRPTAGIGLRYFF